MVKPGDGASVVCGNTGLHRLPDDQTDGDWIDSHWLALYAVQWNPQEVVPRARGTQMFHQEQCRGPTAFG